jgi:hypothetical protein
MEYITIVEVILDTMAPGSLLLSQVIWNIFHLKSTNLLSLLCSAEFLNVYNNEMTYKFKIA